MRTRHEGSSPLARGLRGTCTHSGLWITDHPRSRGVYIVGARPAVGKTGSSPLARGFRSTGAAGTTPARIIPARAGFTARRHRRHRPPSDHPRSRGVYSWSPATCPNAWGSSPLARGLRASLLLIAAIAGIIPARAGFTRRRRPGPRPRQDHPRSRGVYDDGKSVPVVCGGSSPLARGLLARVGRCDDGEGIIPARAGFTTRRTGLGTRPGDHPRSRGVYAESRVMTPAEKGSSPLARGLHARGGRPLAGRRIIPARAGFTCQAAGG